MKRLSILVCELNAENERLKAAIKENQKLIEFQQETNRRLKLTISSHKDDAQVKEQFKALASRILELEKELDSKKTRIDELNEEIREKYSEVFSRGLRIKSLQNDQEDLVNRIRELELENSKNPKRAQLKVLRHQVEAARKERDMANNSLFQTVQRVSGYERHDATLTELLCRINVLENELSHYKKFTPQVMPYKSVKVFTSVDACGAHEHLNKRVKAKYQHFHGQEETTGILKKITHRENGNCWFDVKDRDNRTWICFEIEVLE